MDGKKEEDRDTWEKTFRRTESDRDKKRKTIGKLVSLGDAVEREEHADVDGTASKKTSPSVAQRSKKKKKQTKIYYVHITSEKMVYNSGRGKKSSRADHTKHLIFVFLEKDEKFFNFLVCARVFFSYCLILMS